MQTNFWANFASDSVEILRDTLTRVHDLTPSQTGPVLVLQSSTNPIKNLQRISNSSWVHNPSSPNTAGHVQIFRRRITYPDFELQGVRCAKGQDPVCSLHGSLAQISRILLSISSRNANTNMSDQSKNLTKHFARFISELYPDNDFLQHHINVPSDFLTQASDLLPVARQLELRPRRFSEMILLMIEMRFFDHPNSAFSVNIQITSANMLELCSGWYSTWPPWTWPGPR